MLSAVCLGSGYRSQVLSLPVQYAYAGKLKCPNWMISAAELHKCRRPLHGVVNRIATFLLPPPQGQGGIKGWCASDVWLSVAYIGPKSRKDRHICSEQIGLGTDRPRKTKIGTEVAHVTRDSRTPRSKGQLAGGRANCGGLPHSLLVSECCKR